MLFNSYSPGGCWFLKTSSPVKPPDIPVLYFSRLPVTNVPAKEATNLVLSSPISGFRVTLRSETPSISASSRLGYCDSGDVRWKVYYRSKRYGWNIPRGSTSRLRCPVHESTVSNLPVLAVLFTLVHQHTFMTPGTPSPFFNGWNHQSNFRPQCGTDTLRFLLVVIFTHSCFMLHSSVHIQIFTERNSINVNLSRIGCISPMESEYIDILIRFDNPRVEPTICSALPVMIELAICSESRPMVLSLATNAHKGTKIISLTKNPMFGSSFYCLFLFFRIISVKFLMVNNYMLKSRNLFLILLYIVSSQPSLPPPKSSIKFYPPTVNQIPYLQKRRGPRRPRNSRAGGDAVLFHEGGDTV